MNLHLKGGNIVLFSLYLLPKEGMQGSNFEKIKAISTVISSITDPWIIMADWNLTPAAVEKSGLPRRLGGTVIRPNVEVTCDKGKGSLIDFALAREDISEGISIEAVAAVPWRTHTGLRLILPGRSQAWWHRHLQLPRPLPVVLPPRKKPDPESKRSKKKEAARLRRQEQLPEYMHEEFDMLEPPPGPKSEEVATQYRIDEAGWLAATAKGIPPTYTQQMEEIEPLLLHHGEHQALMEQAITGEYAAWVTALEEAIIGVETMDANEADAYRGRGGGFAIRWQRSKATPGRTHMKYQPAEFWSIIGTLITRYEALRVNGTDTRQQKECAQQLSSSY